MTRQKRRIYRSHDPLRIALTVLLAVVLAAVIFCVGVFFGFRKYITYTPDGLRVEVPWLQDEAAPPVSPEV